MLSKKNTKNVNDLVIEQLGDVKNCLVAFEGFMRAATTPETTPEVLRSLSVGISDLEAVADRSLRKMIDSLASNSFLPSTRQEIISIVTACDHIANKCEHIANTWVYQRFDLPAEYGEQFMKMISLTFELYEILETSIGRLFSSFNALLKDHSILDDIRHKESEVDVVEKELYIAVFATDLDLAKKQQISQFVEWLADISDIIENLADKIQIMLITRKA